MAIVHIGEKIKEVLQKSHMGATKFGAAINRSRTVVYDIFERDSIDTGLLQKISIVLQHNFFNYYVEEFQVIQDRSSTYPDKPDLLLPGQDELKYVKKQLSDKDKKYDKLQKGHQLLKQKLQKNKRRKA